MKNLKLISTLMEACTKESGEVTAGMGKVCLHGKVVRFTLEISETIGDTAKGINYTLMVQNTQVNGEMTKEMVKESLFG